MSTIFLLLLVAATVAVVGARLSRATAALLAVLFLVPGNLVLDRFPTELPLFRVVLWSYALGLVLRVVRGEIAVESLRPTRLQAALAIFLTVALVNGVALTPVDNRLGDATLTWLSLFDQMVTLTVILVAARVLGAWTIAKMVAGFAGVVGAIGVWEHISETSYARWWFVEAGKADVPVAASRLTARGDQVRVRGPYQFALEFSWVATMLLPVVVVSAVRARRRLALAAPGLLALALLWSWSRSVFAGLAVSAVVVVVASRLDRRLTAAVAAVGLVGLIVFFGSPGVRNPFDAADDDSAESRVRRLAFITESVVDDPYSGLGLAGLRTRGLGGADASYTLTYASLGVPGALTLAVAQAAAIGTCAAGVWRRRDRQDRILAAAALAGVAAGIVGNFALDLVSVPGSGKTFWIIAGIGAAIATEGPPRRARPTRARWIAVPAAAGVGVAVLAVWPTHYATTYRFETIEDRELARTSADVVWGGTYLVNTACEVVEFVRDRLPRASIDCRDPFDAPGLGRLRIEAGDAARVQEVAAGLEAEVTRVLAGFALHESHTGEGRPTGVVTMPVWLPGLAVLTVLLVPPWDRRRTAAPGPDGSDPDALGSPGTLSGEPMLVPVPGGDGGGSPREPRTRPPIGSR